MPATRVRELLLSAIAAYEPTHVRVVFIRRWFGPRWLGFAGKLLGVLEVRDPMAVIPPFNPNRVACEVDLRLPGHMCAGYTLHARRTSEANTDMYMRGVGSNGSLMAWLSVSEPREGTTDDDRACMMVNFIAAAPRPTRVTPIRWYAQCIGAERLILEPHGIGWDELRWIESHTCEDKAIRDALLPCE